jgi:hypothetical protein
VTRGHRLIFCPHTPIITGGPPPFLLDFTGEQVELNHQEFDDLSITWNTIDPHQPVLWPEFDLRWHHDMYSGSHALQGQVLQDVELLEWTGSDMAQGNGRCRLPLPPSQLTIANTLDKSGHLRATRDALPASFTALKHPPHPKPGTLTRLYGGPGSSPDRQIPPCPPIRHGNAPMLPLD